MNEIKTPPIITELYKKRVVVKLFPDSHQYWVTIDGGKPARKTGVTTYIGIKDKSRALQSWQQVVTADVLLEKIARKEPIDVESVLAAVVECEVQKDKAADIGKQIHGWIELYIRNKLKQVGFEDLPDMPSFNEAVIGTNAFFAWEKAHKVKYISTESPIYSLTHDYVGTEDLLAVIDDELSDSDFKSSNGLYNGVRMQTAMYKFAREEEGGKKSKSRWAIRFSKYSEEEYMKREERKKEIRRMIAKIKGNTPSEYPMKPYQVFEAKYLDESKEFYERDLKAALHCKALYEWDKKTDSFYNPNW